MTDWKQVRDESAFPTKIHKSRIEDCRSLDLGLTKRELFAAMALQGLCACPTAVGGIARDAVEFADALLAELAKETK